MWVLDLKLGSSCLCGRHLTNWPASPAPLSFRFFFLQLCFVLKIHCKMFTLKHHRKATLMITLLLSSNGGTFAPMGHEGLPDNNLGFLTGRIRHLQRVMCVEVRDPATHMTPRAVCTTPKKNSRPLSVTDISTVISSKFPLSLSWKWNTSSVLLVVWTGSNGAAPRSGASYGQFWELHPRTWFSLSTLRSGRSWVSLQALKQPVCRDTVISQYRGEGGITERKVMWPA